MNRSPIMNLQQIKEKVLSNCKEGDKVSVLLNQGEANRPIPVLVKILSFYDNHLLTEHDGYKECFTYREFLRMAAGAKAYKNPPIVIPDSLKTKVHERK